MASVELGAVEEKRKQAVIKGLCLYVKGMGFTPSANELVLYFTQFGHISEVEIEDHYSLVYFELRHSVQKALTVRHHTLRGQRLTVKQQFYSGGKEATDEGNLSKKRGDVEIQVLESMLSAENVIEQFQFFKNMLLSEEELQERQDVEQSLNNLFSTYFDVSSVQLFGSSANSLGLKGCDIDILLSLRSHTDDEKVITYPKRSCRKTFYTLRNLIDNRSRLINSSLELMKLTAIDVVHLLQKILVKEDKCKDVTVIPSQRCPLVHFIFCSSCNNMIDCDLSCKNRMAVYNTKLVQFYTRLDYRVMPFLTFVRYWAVEKDLQISKMNRLTSYATSMLGIFYLQNTSPTIVPTVEDLREFEYESHVVANVDCSFCDNVELYSPSENTDDLVTVLKGFYKYYNQFDLKKFVISIVTGKLLSTDDFSASYPDFPLKEFNIQDPFELDRNVTGNVDVSLMEKIKDAFIDAVGVCEDDELWQPRVEAPWGLLSLLKKLNNNAELNKTEDQSSSLKRKSVQSSSTKKISVLSAKAIDRIRVFCPGPASRTNTSDRDCFDYICQAVCTLFTKGLQLPCSSSDSACEQSEETSTKSKRTRLDTTTSENEDPEVILMSKAYKITVDYNFWTERKNAGTEAKQMTVVEREEATSTEILGKKHEKRKLLFTMVLDIQLSRQLNAFIVLTGQTEDQDLNHEMISFLESYVPSILQEMINREECF